MKKLMRCFGYISFTELVEEAKKYEKEKFILRDNLWREGMDLEIDERKEKFLDGISAGYEGLGVLEFVNRVLKRKTFN